MRHSLKHPIGTESESWLFFLSKWPNVGLHRSNLQGIREDIYIVETDVDAINLTYFSPVGVADKRMRFPPTSSQDSNFKINKFYNPTQCHVP